MIVVAPGSNSLLDKDDVERVKGKMAEADCVVMQLEIPLETVEYATKLAREAKTQIILDPAPEDPSRWPSGERDVLTPNEDEAQIITGLEINDLATAEKAAKALLARGPGAVVITLGGLGALAVTEEETIHIHAFAVDTVDTTGAGDAFNGALAAALAEKRSLAEACRFAAAAAALSVTKVGTSIAAPYRSEVEEFLRQQGGK